MIAEVLGLHWAARTAWFALTRELDELDAAGRTVPCRADPLPFTSDARADRDEAAAACRACPALIACATFAHANHEPVGVWGGIDLTPRLGRSPRAPRAELAALLELDPIDHEGGEVA